MWCLCSWLSFPLLFLGSDVMLGSYTVLPSPFLSSPRSLLVLIFLRGERCVCICLCCCTKETHCVLRVGFWLNKSELSLVQQGSGGAGQSSNLEAAPGLPSSLPAPTHPAGPCRSNGTLLAGLEKFQGDPAGICRVLPVLLPFAAMILMWVNALFNSAGVGEPRRLLGSAA